MKTKPFTLGLLLAGTAIFTAVAGAQDLFVSDFTDGNIYRVTPNGMVSVYASGMDYPYGIAFNRAGDLFIANSALDDGTEGNIEEINPNGAPYNFYSNIDPKAVAVDSRGDVFEADYHSGIIFEYTPDGVQSTFATGYWAPLALAFDNQDNLYIGDGYGNGNGRVTEVMRNGRQRIIATGLSYPSIAVNSAGDVFVADQGDGYIYEYPRFGPPRTIAIVGGVNGDNNGLAFDNAGNLFVVNGLGFIVEITPWGWQRTFATIPGNPAGLAFAPPGFPQRSIVFPVPHGQ